MIKRLLSVLTAALTAPAFAAQVVLNAVPGGVVEIPLDSAEQARPAATFGQKRVLVTEFGSRWVGLVGLPLGLVPGKYIIQARHDGQDEPVIHEFAVYPRRTDRQAVVQLPETPPVIDTIDFTWRDSLDARFPLAPPLPGPAQKLFGHYWQASETRSEHVNFVAFRVAADTAVKAPANGRIAATVRHEKGTVIWIDHGMGLYTSIGPVTHTTHRPNETVEAGQNIGKVTPGKAGKSRSAYWSVFLNDTAIDPFLVSTLNPNIIDDESNRAESGS